MQRKKLVSILGVDAMPLSLKNLLLNGQLWQIFVWQDRYSGGHITGALQLPPPRSISQNLGKTSFLAVLPDYAYTIPWSIFQS